MMEFKEFSKEKNETALLLHGGYVSYRTLNVQIQALKQKFHVIVPILSGHNLNNQSELISIEEEAKTILNFLAEKKINKIHTLYGVSLGADIALEILALNGNLCEYAFIESGSLGIPKIASFPLVKITETAMYRGVRGSKIWENYINKFLINMQMPDYLYEDTKKIISHMTKLTIRNVQKSVCNYQLKENIFLTKTKCLIIYTSKEKLYLQKPYNKMKLKMNNMSITCIKNFNHGQLCIGNPTLLLQMMDEFINTSLTDGEPKANSLIS